MPGLDASVGKEMPTLFLVLSFLIVLGYTVFKAIPQIISQAVEFIKARDAAFVAALEKLSADLQHEQAELEEAHQDFMREQNEMWRSFVRDQWAVIAKSIDGFAGQIAELGARFDQHDKRMTAEHQGQNNQNG